MFGQDFGCAPLDNAFDLIGLHRQTAAAVDIARAQLAARHDPPTAAKRQRPSADAERDHLPYQVIGQRLVADGDEELPMTDAQTGGYHHGQGARGAGEKPTAAVQQSLATILWRQGNPGTAQVKVHFLSMLAASARQQSRLARGEGTKDLRR